MPARPKILSLPADVKAWLDHALIVGNFSEFELLESELKERGFSIGKSSIHRYGQGLERKLAAIKASTDAAAAIAEAAPDDADLRSAAVMSLVQTEIFDVLVTLQEAEDADPTERMKLMSRAAKAVAELSRASVNQKKHQAEVGKRTRAALEKIKAVVSGKGGLSNEVIRQIEEQVLGIAR